MQFKIKKIIMREGGEFRELMLQVFRTRMSFRRAMQRTLKRNNAGITFEMLQILSSLWHEQGITQQVLAERTAKDKACLTNLMNNLEKKDTYVVKKIPQTGVANWFTLQKKAKNSVIRFGPYWIKYM